MTTQWSQDPSLRAIHDTAEANKVPMKLPTVEPANLMDLSLKELANLQGSKNNCSLCQSPNHSSDTTISGIRLPCDHTFCVECTTKWFYARAFHNACPSCDTEFFRTLHGNGDDDESLEVEEEEYEEGDDESSEVAQGLRYDDEENDEYFEITHFDKCVDNNEDEQTAGERGWSAAEYDSPTALGAPGSVDAATTTAPEMVQLGFMRRPTYGDYIRSLYYGNLYLA